jgi:hypothetical protein
MDDCRSNRQLEAEVILRKIIADFEQLDLAIDSAITDLQAGSGPAEDIEVLERARDAARKGAALARNKIDSE